MCIRDRRWNCGQTDGWYDTKDYGVSAVSTPERTGNPSWFQKGGPGGPGRTPLAVKLAKRLWDETDGGEDVIKLVLGIAFGTSKMQGKGKRGRAWSEASRRWAIELVTDRLWGKAKQLSL